MLTKMINLKETETSAILLDREIAVKNENIFTTFLVKEKLQGIQHAKYYLGVTYFVLLTVLSISIFV